MKCITNEIKRKLSKEQYEQVYKFVNKMSGHELSKSNLIDYLYKRHRWDKERLIETKRELFEQYSIPLLYILYKNDCDKFMEEITEVRRLEKLEKMNAANPKKCWFLKWTTLKNLEYMTDEYIKFKNDDGHWEKLTKDTDKKYLNRIVECFYIDGEIRDADNSDLYIYVLFRGQNG